MNIFEIFCVGNGRINETNMSSVLGFLLNPEASHGYGRSFLGRFLVPIQSKLEQLDCWSRIRPRNTEQSIQQAINAFSKIQITLEESVARPALLNAGDAAEDPVATRRNIDLTIRLFLPDDQLQLVIAIENKIKQSSAADVNQLKQEYELLRDKIASEQAEGNPRVPIVFIYLTDRKVDNSPKLQRQWTNLDIGDETGDGNCDFKTNYCWKHDCDWLQNIDNQPTITTFALSILEMEQLGKINPASSHSNLLLRSLIRFIGNDFGPEREIYGTEAQAVDMAVMPIDDFWHQFGESRRAVATLAGHVFQHLGGAISQENSNQLYARNWKLNHRSTQTRITFFIDDQNCPAQMTDRTLPRPIARIRKDGRTSNTMLHLEFAKSSDVLFQDIFPADMQGAMQGLGLQFTETLEQPRYDLYVPVGVNFENLRDILTFAQNAAVTSVLD